MAISAFIFIFFSNQAPPPGDEIISQFTFKRELINQENDNLVWYKDYKIWSFILFISIVTIFILLFKV